MGVSLTEQAAEQLVQFAVLLRERAIPLGLISTSDAARVYERHVLDSLRAASLFSPGDKAAFDLGPGAGLPGVVLAAAVPWCRFLLVEPRRIRVGFLELALEALDLPNAEVAAVRAEEVDGLADVVTARAFAPLSRAWRVASRMLRSSGRLVYFAGESLVDPIAEAELATREGPAAEVTTNKVLATSPPLVIITRK
jgi:16S rRNA (guanine527-N7)-methyltransferase